MIFQDLTPIYLFIPIYSFFSNELIIAGRAVSVARDKGEVEKDEEGVQMAQTLGQRIAWMVKKLYD